MADLEKLLHDVTSYHVRVGDCPKCNGAITTMEESEQRLPEQRIKITCNKCDYFVFGHDWREALDKWNAGKEEQEIIETEVVK